MTTLRQPQSVAVVAHLQRADDHLGRGYPEAALTELDLAYLIDPDDAGVRYKRGQALAMLGRFAAAVAELDAAVALYAISNDAGNADAWLQRGLAHLALENWAYAAADCSQALQLDASPPEAWQARAQAYYRMGELNAAIADFTAALSRRPADAASLYGRGLVLRDAGRNADAIPDFTAAIALNDRYTVAYVARGKAYAALGQMTAARSDWDMAAQMLHQSH